MLQRGTVRVRCPEKAALTPEQIKKPLFYLVLPQDGSWESVPDRE
jgi:hypothetical protein